MKAVLLDKAGPPSSLRAGEIPTPRPRAGEALVEGHVRGKIVALVSNSPECGAVVPQGLFGSPWVSSELTW